MTKQHKNKLDEAVKITTKGNVKITVPGLVVNHFSESVFRHIDFLSTCLSGLQLNSTSYTIYAEQAFMAGLYKKHFEYRALPDKDYSFQVNRSEAYLLMGIMAHGWSFDHSLIKALQMKLQQKLT